MMIVSVGLTVMGARLELRVVVVVGAVGLELRVSNWPKFVRDEDDPCCCLLDVTLTGGLLCMIMGL